MHRRHRFAAALVGGALAVAGCGGATAGTQGGDRATIAVTTGLLGDVVRNLTGDQAAVEVVMPPGADPHEFQPSARQAAALREADVIVANGGGLEAGLADTLDGARRDGVPVFQAFDHVATLDDDPHFFTDPARTADAAQALADLLAAEAPGLDGAGFAQRAAGYVAELRALDREVEAVVSRVPAERRRLVTNHVSLAYFADRYGFEVVGAVVPATTTQAGASAAAIADLAATIAAAGVPAVFTDTSSPDELTRVLADEAGGVRVVELYTESLGEEGSGADSYTGMIRTDAARIAAALTP